jgi:hypothetical protein
MATYPITGSTLQSGISTGLSTQILIKVEDETVGAIQSITITQSRNLERIKEVGLDGVLEIVPRAPTEYEAAIQRIVFDRLRLPQAFARGYVNIKSQLLPFDIQIIDRSNGDGEGAIVHTLENCWFARYAPRYQSDNFIIQEDATIWIEDIRSNVGTTQRSAVIGGGARGISYQVDTFGREQATDAGAGGSLPGSGYRGTMDVANLMSAAFSE